MTEAMNVVSKQWEDNGTIRAFGMIGGVVAAGLFGTATVYLGIFSYKNPDPLSCWVVHDLHSAWKSKSDAIARADAMDVDVTSGFPMEMHAVFLVWFLWGFWAKVSLLISIVTGFVARYFNEYAG